MRILVYLLLLIAITPFALWVLDQRRQMWRSNSPWHRRRRKNR